MSWSKADRIREEDAEEADAEVSEPLDPAFPFRVIEFDPDFFGIDANPPPVESDE